MDRMIYIAMTGARESMLAQSVNNNNLANAATVGFRADLHHSLSQPLYGDGYASRVYADTVSSGTDFTPGQIMHTGRDLDIAVNGKGWIAVMAPDGTEAYSRAGDLRIDSLGRLSNGAGHLVMGNGGPISIPPHASLQIGGDGTISIQPMGQSANTLAVVDRIKLVNPAEAQLHKSEDGLMRTRGGNPAEADANVTMVSGALENSNVSTVRSMVEMIELARQYETHIKMMSTAEENDKASAQMLQMS